MMHKEERPKISVEKQIKMLSEFRKRVLKNKIQKFYSDKFNRDLREFIPIPTECSITLEELRIPIRSTSCDNIKCVFELESLIQQYSEDICAQNYMCKVCGQHRSNNSFFFDQSTAYYLKQARKNIPNFDTRILGKKIQFGLNKAKKFTYCIQDEEKQLQCLHQFDNKQEKSSTLQIQEHNDEESKCLSKEITCISDKVITHVKQQAEVYKNAAIQEDIQVDVQNFISEFQRTLQENLQIKTCDSQSSFFENQFSFCIDQDFNKKQDHIYINVPFLNQKWYKTSLMDWRDPSKPFKHSDFTSFCKYYNPSTQQHSIIMLGGKDPNDRFNFFNRCIEIPLFKNHPSEIQPTTIMRQMPDMPKKKAMVNCLTFNGNIYVFGGFQQYSDHNTPMAVPFCEVYDYKNQKWEVLPDMPQKSIVMNFLRSQDKVYMIGGYDEENQQAVKTQNRNLIVFDLKSHKFQTYMNVLPNMSHIDQEGVKYFKGRGMGFIKQNDETICIFGGRNLEDNKFEVNKANQNRKYFMSEFHLESQNWCITDIHLQKASDASMFQQDHKHFDLTDKYQHDFEPVYCKDRVYFTFIYNNKPKLVTYDEYADVKLTYQECL